MAQDVAKLDKIQVRCLCYEVQEVSLVKLHYGDSCNGCFNWMNQFTNKTLGFFFLKSSVSLQVYTASFIIGDIFYLLRH